MHPTMTWILIHINNFTNLYLYIPIKLVWTLFSVQQNDEQISVNVDNFVENGAFAKLLMWTRVRIPVPLPGVPNKRDKDLSIVSVELKNSSKKGVRKGLPPSPMPIYDCRQSYPPGFRHHRSSTFPRFLVFVSIFNFVVGGFTLFYKLIFGMLSKFSHKTRFLRLKGWKNVSSELLTIVIRDHKKLAFLCLLSPLFE